MSVTDLNIHSVLDGLAAREETGRPVRVALVGAGRFGTTVAAAVGQMRGMRLSLVCDLNPDSAKMAAEAGSRRGNVTEVTDDLSRALEAPVDVVVEATGSPFVAARVADGAIKAGKHVVMVTVEADVLLGAALAQRARAAGVVYTLADGDQPAVTKRMVDWATAAGYKVVAAGRGTRMYPEDVNGQPEDAFARYGFDPDIIERRRFNARMYNSFRDGSKAQIEMCALANATGLVPDRRGMHEPSAGYTDLPSLFRPKAEGGLLENVGVVELANAVGADGRTLMPNEITNGVWVVVTTEQRLLHEDLPFYGLPASPDKRYAAFWRPYHLCGVETPMSVAEAALFGKPTAAAQGAPVAEVVAIAKRDLKPGDRLDGSGGGLVRGQVERIEVALAERLLPLGLADGVELLEPVGAGQPIPRKAVAAPTGVVHELRLEHEALARRPSS